METLLYTDGAKVKIGAGPAVVIGEKINPTGRKKLAAALQARDFDYVVELATTQVAWGADVLDVNVGVPGIDEVALLPEVVKLVTSVVKTPICIDTPESRRAGRRAAGGAGQAAGQLGQRRGEVAAAGAAPGEGSRRGGDRPDHGRQRHPGHRRGTAGRGGADHRTRDRASASRSRISSSIRWC